MNILSFSYILTLLLRKKHYLCTHKLWAESRKNIFLINPVEKFGCLQPLKKMLKLRPPHHSVLEFFHIKHNLEK